MEDKQVPWWRRALKFALGGIRSAFGIFARPEKSGTAVEQQSANGGEREIKVEDYRIEESEEETELTDISPTPEALEAAIPEAADQLAVPAVPQAPAVMAAPEEQQTTEHSQDEAANQVEAAEYVADELDSAQVQVLETQAAATAADTELDRVAPETESSEAAEIMHEFQAAPIEPESAQSSACANDPVDEGAPLAEAANTGAAAPEFPDPRMELNPTNREETAEDRQPEPEQAVESMANFGETAEESAARAISRPDRTEDAPTVEIEEQTVVASEKSAEPRVNDATKSGTDEAAAEPAPGAGTIAAPAEEQKTVAAPEQRAIGATKTEPAAAVEAPVKHFIKMEARENQIDPSAFSVIVSQVYDGPLDLLLDLIRKQDIDIYDIPIARITAQFLSYVNQLKATDVDVAGEFIYTASLLIHIKSKMLLPRAPAGPDDAAEDPRRELVERLLEHERFKNAAQMLQQKQMLEAATWTSGSFATMWRPNRRLPPTLWTWFAYSATYWIARGTGLS
jgi:hypothetical protein